MDDYNARPIPLDEGPFPISEVEQVIAQLQSLQASLPSGRGQLTQTQVQDTLDDLPRLTEQDVGNNDACPICFNPYLAILAEEEMAIAMDSPAHPVEYLGVTKLSRSWQCGHVFCRKDISKWIEEGHDSCPLCRHLLVKPRSPAEGNSPLEGAQPNHGVTNFEAVAAQLDLLRSSVNAVSAPYDLYDDIQRMARESETAARTHDRSEFSGMYS